jgi:MFS family permease
MSEHCQSAYERFDPPAFPSGEASRPCCVSKNEVPSNKLFGSDGNATNVKSFVYNILWPGLGLLGESYMLFSIGTLRPLWEYIIENTIGDANGAVTARLLQLLNQLPYAACSGIICGMIFFGFMADRYGRRIGSISTASCMFLGSIGMTLAAGCTIDYRRSPQHFSCCWHSLIWSILLFGFGVGGEYPVAAASATERSMAHGSSGQSKSGKHIQLVFTMQGVGILLQVCLLTLLLLVLRHSMKYGNNENMRLSSGFSTVWFTLYFFGMVILCFVLVTRICHLQESSIWKSASIGVKDIFAANLDQLNSSMQMKGIALSSPPPSSTCSVSTLSIPPVHEMIDANASEPIANSTTVFMKKNSSKNFDRDRTGRTRYPNEGISATPSRNDPCESRRNRCDGGLSIPEEQSVDNWTLTKIFMWSQYGLRLLSVSVTWFLWDVAFYGNKLFQSTFLLFLTNDVDSNIDPFRSLIRFAVAATLNAVVALLGYIAAAHALDHPYFGRRTLQFYGFVSTGCLFLGVGFLYENLSTTVLIIMYFGTSFFGQFGPNATTFILPAEVFPTELRTICHGIAAACGKLGALTATIAFHHVSNDLDLFLLSGYASFIAAIVTYWFIPETRGHDLAENDRYWTFLVSSFLSSTSRNSQECLEAQHFPLNSSFLSVYERRRLLRNRETDFRDDEALLYS